MKFTKEHYVGLLIVLFFFLATQVFQQYTMMFGVMSEVTDLHSGIVIGQHISNKVRLFGILMSMFLLIYGYSVLSLSFFKQRPLSSILALIFFLIFCGIEISYRSIEFFYVLNDMGATYAVSDSATQAQMLPRFREIHGIIAAAYFPLLMSHLLASVFLVYASLPDASSRLITIAMAINAVRLLIRLTGFTPFEYLNIFSGPLYFPPVAVVFVLMIIWSVRRIKVQPGIS